MHHELVALWLSVVMLVSVPSIIVGSYITFKYPLMEYFTDSFLSKMFKIGLSLGMIGLSVQTYRTLFYFQHNAYPTDMYFPTWATKDVGFCLIIVSLALQHMKAKKGE